MSDYSSKIIQIAWDTEFYRVPLSSFLAKEGFRTVVFEDPIKAAVEIPERLSETGLITVDLSEPTFPGFDLLEDLNDRGVTGRVPVWVVDNLYQRRDVSELKQMRVKGVLDKSVSPEEIVAKIQQMVFGDVVEARKNPRIPVLIPVEWEFKDQVASAYISSLSGGGAFIHTDRTPYLGSEIGMRFRLPRHKKVIQSGATVLYIAPKNQKGQGSPKPPGMGVRFKELDAESSALIKKYVDTYSRKKVDDYQVIFGMS